MGTDARGPATRGAYATLWRPRIWHKLMAKEAAVHQVDFDSSGDLAAPLIGLDSTGSVGGLLALDDVGCGRDSRAESRRANLQMLMERMWQRRGCRCTLTQSVDGAYEYAELTYERPNSEPTTVRLGWAVGESDNQSIVYALMSLELLAALSE